jgi:hypothetical protein
LLFIALTEQLQLRPELVRSSLLADYKRSGQKGIIDLDSPGLKIAGRPGVANKRQRQHSQLNA